MQDDVIYNDIGRFYNVDGCYYPSVTTVLSFSKKDSIKAWADRVGEKKKEEILKYTSDRGNVVHYMCEEYLKTGVVPEVSNKLFYYLFLKIKDWLDKNIVDVILQEEMLFSNKLKIAGRVDLIANTVNGLQIIDFKTSTNIKVEEYIQNYFMQCAAYSVCYYEMTGKFINNFSVVIVEEKANKLNVFSKNSKDYIEDFIRIRKDFKKCYDI